MYDKQHVEITDNKAQVYFTEKHFYFSKKYLQTNSSEFRAILKLLSRRILKVLKNFDE